MQQLDGTLDLQSGSVKGKRSMSAPPSMVDALSDDDAPLQGGVARVRVIVEPARSDGDEVAALTALTRPQEPDRVQGGAVRVFGVRIGRHLVLLVVTVHEQHARPRRHGQFGRADRAVAPDGDAERVVRGG